MAETKKFLDSTGLGVVWGQVKTLVSNYINILKTQLSSDASGNGAYVTVSIGMKNGVLTNVGVNDTALSGELKQINDSVSENTSNISNIKPKADNITLDNNAFNISATNGVVATNFSTAEGNLNNVISRLKSVEATLSTAEDADAIINTLKDVIDFFNNLGEDVTTITAMISDIAENSRLIGSIQESIANIDLKIGKIVSENATHIHEYTPSGSVISVFDGTSATISGGSHTHNYTPSGSVIKTTAGGSVTPISSYDNTTGIATLSASFSGAEHTHTFTGTSSTVESTGHTHSYTPSGSVSSTFTGTSATISGGSHNHTITIKES